MKTKTCDHAWRVFGNYAHEEVYPVFTDCGWIQCVKCGEDTCVNKYKVVKKIPPVFPAFVVFGWPICDEIVEIIEK
jgi:hypothetical protein